MKKSRKNSNLESKALQVLNQLTVDSVKPPRVQHIQPKNDKQQDLLNAIKAYPITVTIGSAGTGKTYCSTSMMASLYLSGKYTKIVLTRSNVPTGRSLGAFPGTVQEKMAPWLLPITNVLERYFGESFYQYLCRKQVVEIQPLETIRGRSYENSLVIVDEAQNLTIEELKAITTRLGENSKMVLTGDNTQADIKNGEDLLKFVNACEKHGIHIPIIKFNSDDIVRSDIVGQLVKMFEKEGL
jgi:phosphate starvation-inducible protein PhoH and related proteins